MDTKVHYNRTPTRKCYIYSKANWENINKEQLQTTIEANNQKEDSVQQLWSTFKADLFKTMDANIPNKEIRSRNNIPWIKHKHKKMLKRKQRLYKQARKTRKWTNYRAYQKECKRSLRRAEWEYVNSNIIEGLQNNNNKPFWKYVKSKRQDSNGIAPLKHGTTLVNDSKGKAELLLKQFKSVFTRTSKAEMPETRISPKVSSNQSKLTRKASKNY
ncbi:hypothetical protein FSP39_022689 [Pinctada imbricata]|uniref:Uncharacterized protein n=1 Tax=Pinctada imbricata TaxID=66713 RepID=A0AA88YAH1_PINIB|nr:hypothetical protein FSP39_022689 [Pinctada imbricata]